MIQTVVRVYNPTPEDVEVRDPGHVDGELVVAFGPVVALQGHPATLRRVLTQALFALGDVTYTSEARRAADEAVDDQRAATEFLVDEPIDGSGF